MRICKWVPSTCQLKLLVCDSHPSASSTSPSLSLYSPPQKAKKGDLFWLGGHRCNPFVLSSHWCPTEYFFLTLKSCSCSLKLKNCQRNANQYQTDICLIVLLPGPPTLPSSLTKACCRTSQQLQGFQQCNVWETTAITYMPFSIDSGRFHA